MLVPAAPADTVVASTSVAVALCNPLVVISPARSKESIPDVAVFVRAITSNSPGSPRHLVASLVPPAVPPNK